MSNPLFPLIQYNLIRFRIELDRTQKGLVVAVDGYRKVYIQSVHCPGAVVSEFLDEVERHLTFIPF